MDFEPRILSGYFKKALILERPDPSLDHHLAELGIECDRIDRALNEDEVIAALNRGGHDLIFKRSRTPITRAVLEAGTSLHAVMLCCIGDDSVDKQAAADHGVLVLNDPVSNGRSVVEMVVGEMITLARRLHQAHRETRGHSFVKENRSRYELEGRWFGVLGLGNIGKQVAQVAADFGMEVCFYDNREVSIEVGEHMGWRFCDSIEGLFAQSNVVTAHVSATDYLGRSNEGVLQYEHFKAMGAPGKDGPRIFLNAGRGVLHTPEDLVRAVKEGHVQSAFVDVYPEEPRSAQDAWTNPYADLPSVLTTPHIGAATLEAQPRIARQMATTTRKLMQAGTVRNCVFRPGRPIAAEARPGRTVLSVVHSDARGTKKAVDDAIYEAGASNLQSTHRDFPRYGIAYDLNILDRPLTRDQIQAIVDEAVELTGEPTAIRAVRQFETVGRGR